jgi:hypothetical protein
MALAIESVSTSGSWAHAAAAALVSSSPYRGGELRTSCSIALAAAVAVLVEIGDMATDDFRRRVSDDVGCCVDG